MKIHTFDTPEETAKALTHELLKQLDVVRRDAFHLAISGGHSSELLFEIWAQKYYKSIPWHRIHLYWADERCVPPTHQESNYGMARRLFLEKVPVPPHQIHRILGESNPENEARRYAELVKTNLPLKDDYPAFDVILLGIGTDGHTSSLFPDRKDLLIAPETYAVATNPYTGQKRITLTGPPILRAGRTLFHVVGKEKAPILAQIINAPAEAEQYPSGYITQNADHAEYFIDKAAASLLK